MIDWKAQSKEFSVFSNQLPWVVTNTIKQIITEKISSLSDDFDIQGNVAIHKTAYVNEDTQISGPVILCENTKVHKGTVLRDGVYLSENTVIGHCCEVKSSAIFSNTKIAHFNYVGNSIIGSNCSFEAGAVVANKRNEYQEENIQITVDGKSVDTGQQVFGAFVSDGCKIGANAVLSPGTILEPNTIVARLELVDQS